MLYSKVIASAFICKKLPQLLLALAKLKNDKRKPPEILYPDASGLIGWNPDFLLGWKDSRNMSRSVGMKKRKPFAPKKKVLIDDLKPLNKAQTSY